MTDLKKKITEQVVKAQSQQITDKGLATKIAEKTGAAIDTVIQQNDKLIKKQHALTLNINNSNTSTNKLGKKS